MNLDLLLNPPEGTDEVGQRVIPMPFSDPPAAADMTSNPSHAHMGHHSPEQPVATFLSPSLEVQQEWMRQIVNDTDLYGNLPPFADTKTRMRIRMAAKISELIGRIPAQPPIRVQVEQETDLQAWPTQRKYKDTPSFLEYRRQLNTGSSYANALSANALRSLPSFTPSSSYQTAHTSPSSTGSRSAGFCETDIGLFVYDLLSATINGTLELKKLKKKEVQGTPLAYPPYPPDSIPLSPVKELAAEDQTYIMRGLAQAIWYGCVEQEMMSSDNHLPPVLVGYLVNQYFVRILVLENTIYIEAGE